jgi:XTP/dITP diphosphohydrolase
MKSSLFATNNPGKVSELKKMLQSEGMELLTLSDLGLVFVPEETGATFEENAVIKAAETAALLKKHKHEGFVVFADDSGLEIDALQGKPGVDSAIFLGEDATYEERFAEIFARLENEAEENRTARFVCVMACVLPEGRILTARGTVEGRISRECFGEGGFGYDPIFFLPGRGKTIAQLSAAEKNEISHRGQALRAMLAKLKKEKIF